MHYNNILVKVIKNFKSRKIFKENVFMKLKKRKNFLEFYTLRIKTKNIIAIKLSKVNRLKNKKYKYEIRNKIKNKKAEITCKLEKSSCFCFLIFS